MYVEVHYRTAMYVGDVTGNPDREKPPFHHLSSGSPIPNWRLADD